MRRDSIAVVNLEPGVVATERMTLVTTQQGIPPVGVSVDVPGSVCAYLATHATPMAFSGRTVDAPQFCVWAGLVRGDEMPVPLRPLGVGRSRPHPVRAERRSVSRAVSR